MTAHKRPPTHPGEILREDVLKHLFAGNGPSLWLRMQQAYDLWHTENRMMDELSRIEPIVSELKV